MTKKSSSSSSSSSAGADSDSVDDGADSDYSADSADGLVLPRCCLFVGGNLAETMPLICCLVRTRT